MRGVPSSEKPVPLHAGAVATSAVCWQAVDLPREKAHVRGVYPLGNSTLDHLTEGN